MFNEKRKRIGTVNSNKQKKRQRIKFLAAAYEGKIDWKGEKGNAERSEGAGPSQPVTNGRARGSPKCQSFLIPEFFRFNLFCGGKKKRLKTNLLASFLCFFFR